MVGVTVMTRHENDGPMCEDRLVKREATPWLLAVPLMVAGLLAARAVGSVCASSLEAEGGSEGAERAERVVPFLGEWPWLLAVLAAVLAIGLIRAIVAARGVEGSAGELGPRPFLCLPPVAFVLQELAERSLGREALGFDRPAVLGFALGLAFQLPFAVLAFALGRALLRVARRIAVALAGVPPRTLGGRVLAAPLSCIALPRIPALALGYGQRGPPLVA